jgi:hypothetical protein
MGNQHPQGLHIDRECRDSVEHTGRTISQRLFGGAGIRLALLPDGNQRQHVPASFGCERKRVLTPH